MAKIPSKENHPIRLVRDEYSRFGFAHLSTAAGFSRMIGCSDSLVRNTEAGIFDLSDKLALRIEDGTGVSAKWLKETTDKWRQGIVTTKEPILSAEGKVWSPPDVNKNHFIDEFLHVIELIYGLSPELLPAFMGSVMEAFLTVEASATHNTPTHAGGERERKRVINSYILPVIKLIDTFREEDQQKFFDALESRIGGQDAATSEGLLKMWALMHTKDQYGTCFGRKERTQAPTPREKRTASEPQAKPRLIYFRAAKASRGNLSDSVS